ncbi:hypothetical protein IK7_06102 [Bacillus cereus VD156]|uniref:Uncharacterized protein n=1 Tax=Bacillus cereus (strain VD014) TaxID=1053223 RepID=A0A9W5NM90_BACC8|nr:hypothetical protein IIA_05793 [Bacillus cereus VD014]EJR71778.1 hypothetical protein IK7_06102 [Bacillus cereus VD156]
MGDYTRSAANEIEDNKLIDALIEGGKVKYYKPEGKQRGEWILTVEAMDFLFPKRKEIIK